MSSRPSPLFSAAILGACLLVLGVFVYWWNEPLDRPPGPVSVDVRVVGPLDRPIFNGTGVVVPAENATVLGALLFASVLGNFSVTVTYDFGGEAFVTEIDRARNQGACGWVWTLNSIYGDRSSAKRAVAGGDSILWSWGCEA